MSNYVCSRSAHSELTTNGIQLEAKRNIFPPRENISVQISCNAIIQSISGSIALLISTSSSGAQHCFFDTVEHCSYRFYIHGRGFQQAPGRPDVQGGTHHELIDQEGLMPHAFITTKLDYCNGLLTGLPKKKL